MSDQTGNFSMNRAVFRHPVFYRRPDRIAVWAWMLSTAAWKAIPQDAGGKTVTVSRGQLLTSFRQMETATGVGVQVIRTLMDRLKNEHAIQHETNTGRLLITICNYDLYQLSPKTPNTATNTATNTGLTQDQHTKEEGNNIDTFKPNGLKADESPDPDKVLFDSGVDLLTKAGVPNGQARSTIGKWRKDHGTSAVIEAISRCRREAAINPIEFIQGCFRFQKKKSDPQPGDTRELPDGRVQEYGNSIDGWMTVHT